MEQNVQSNTYSGAEGRGLATILKPYNNDNATAMAMSQMRDIRTFQNKKKADEQKKAEDLYSFKVENKWNKAALDIAKMKDDWQKTYAKKYAETNYNLDRATEQQMAMSGNKLLEYAALANTQQKVAQGKFTTANAKPDVYDVPKLNELIDAEIESAKQKAQAAGRTEPAAWLEYCNIEAIEIPTKVQPDKPFKSEYNVILKTVKRDIPDPNDPKVTITRDVTVPDWEKTLPNIYTKIKTDAISNIEGSASYLKKVEEQAKSEGFKSVDDAIIAAKGNPNANETVKLLYGKSKGEKYEDASGVKSNPSYEKDSYSNGNDWIKNNGIIINKNLVLGRHSNGIEDVSLPMFNQGTIELGQTKIEFNGKIYPHGGQIVYKQDVGGGSSFHWVGDEEVVFEDKTKGLVPADIKLDKTSYWRLLEAKGAGKTKSGAKSVGEELVKAAEGNFDDKAIEVMNEWNKGVSGIQTTTTRGGTTVKPNQTNAATNKKPKPY